MGHRAIRIHLSRLIAGIAATSLFVMPQAAMAWGFFGHQTVARIALANIEPSTRKAIDRLYRADPLLGTPKCPIHNLAQASVWPDCIRNDPTRWGYTFSWHYQTEPVDRPYDARKSCPGGACVSAQITRNYALLADKRLPANVRLEALAFLVHFTGDIHMPLHSGDDDDKGGNTHHVDYGIVKDTNLHYDWDNPLAERAITSGPSLVHKYSAAERARLGGGLPSDWGRESWEITKDFVYRNAFGRESGAGAMPDKGKLTQQAITEAVPVARKRIEQAGLRLAHLLDEAMAPDGPKTIAG